MRAFFDTWYFPACLAQALADLFKPMTEAFNEIWLDGEKAATVEYWQKDIAKFELDKVRHSASSALPLCPGPSRRLSPMSALSTRCAVFVGSHPR